MPLTLGNTTIDQIRLRVQAGRKFDYLTPQPFRLLWRLCQTPNEVVSREDLMMEMWGGTTAEPTLPHLNKIISNIKTVLRSVESDLSVEINRDYRRGSMMGYILHTPDVKTVTEIYTANQHKAVLECIRRVSQQDPQLAITAFGGPLP